MKPGTPPLQSSRLLDQLRERIRYLHYSLSTEKVYLHWVRFFIRWHGRCGQMKHPRTMGAPEIEAFLTMLATERSKDRVVSVKDRQPPFDRQYCIATNKRAHSAYKIKATDQFGIQTQAPNTIPAIAIGSTPVEVWPAVFNCPCEPPNRTGVAAAEGGPDFWYSSMRGHPLRLLRSADTSHKPAERHSGDLQAARNRTTPDNHQKI